MANSVPLTLFRYVSWRFLSSCALVFAALASFVFVINLAELLNRGAASDELTLGVALAMAAFKLPLTLGKMLPFIVLFGAIWMFSRLSRFHELVAIRAAGVSVWQFLAPALIVAFLAGTFAVTIYSPFSAAAASQFEQLEAKHLRGRTSLLAVFQTGVWLRQADAGRQAVIHALRTSDQGLALEDVIVFIYEGADVFDRRIDAKSAVLDAEAGVWRLTDAVETAADGTATKHAAYELPTALTPAEVQDSFASPDTISFWDLPRFIETAEAAGFTAVRHRMHLYALLALPLLACAMVVIAAAFSLKPARLGGTGALLAAGPARASFSTSSAISPRRSACRGCCRRSSPRRAFGDRAPPGRDRPSLHRGRLEPMARPIARLTARLLAAACIGVATAALAQDGATAPREPVYFAAARAVYDGNARTVTLSGGVEFASGGRLLRADQVIYDEAANRAVATGNVSVTEPDGRSATADRLELTGDLKDGLIENIGVVFDENARMAARRATREKGTLTTLFDAVFSPCRVCVEKGHVSPLWSISAVRIVHDAERKTVSYEDATFRVFDSPILTIPAFEHADPSVGRVSGFLSPDAGSSSDIGYFVKVPYYFALAPNYDLTLAPLAATEANPVLFAEWRHRTSSGEYAFSGSYTYDEDRDPFGAPTGTGTSYGHIFGRGRFKLDESYGWGFDVERVSDDTYLERYDISNADRLTSRLFGDWRDGLSYGTISAFAFQGLRSTDDPGLTPVVAPWAELSWVMSDPWMGGAVQLDASAVALTRARGRDVQRASASAQWRLPLIFEGGQAVTFFALGRGDVYRSVEDGREAEVAARLLGHIGIDARWPFVRDGGGGSIQVLEPIAQIVLAPYGDGDDSIPNEDSLSIEFDDTNLFSPVKFPGLDRWEGGPRANLGLRFAHFEADGAFFEVLAGAEFRLEADRTLPGAAGLAGRGRTWSAASPGSRSGAAHRKPSAARRERLRDPPERALRPRLRLVLFDRRHLSEARAGRRRRRRGRARGGRHARPALRRRPLEPRRRDATRPRAGPNDRKPPRRRLRGRMLVRRAGLPPALHPRPRRRAGHDLRAVRAAQSLGRRHGIARFGPLSGNRDPRPADLPGPALSAGFVRPAMVERRIEPAILRRAREAGTGRGRRSRAPGADRRITKSSRARAA